MKKYNVKLLIERDVWVTVKAKNEKEAEEKAMNWNNILNEETDSEDIKTVLYIEVVK